MSNRYFLLEEPEFQEILQSEKDNFIQELNVGLGLMNPLVEEISSEVSDYHIYHDIATGYLLEGDELEGYFMGDEILLDPEDYEEGYIKEGAKVWNDYNLDRYIVLDVNSKNIINDRIFYEIKIAIEDIDTWFIDFWIDTNNGEYKIEREKTKWDERNNLEVDDWMEIINLSFVKQPSED